LEPHIESVQSLYRNRKDVMLEALDSCMPKSIQWTKPRGGFFVWVTLPDDKSSLEVVREAKKASLWIQEGDSFFAEEPTGQHLRLAFSYVEDHKIREGIAKLATLLT
jgi:2-aminoadipate transaminase